MSGSLTGGGGENVPSIPAACATRNFTYLARGLLHWNLFLRVTLSLFQHCFKWWLDANQATSHYLNQWCLGYWCIYASLSLNELTQFEWQIIVWTNDGKKKISLKKWCDQGAVSIRKTVLPGMAIPMLKIRRPNGRLIFNMEIAIRR